MVIEWLKIQVSPEQREIFIQQDHEIWTATLAQYPGFLGKEVWIDPKKPTEIILMIRWAKKEDWDAVPAERLAKTQQRFVEALGQEYQIIETGEYQVRKFPQG